MDKIPPTYADFYFFNAKKKEVQGQAKSNFECFFKINKNTSIMICTHYELVIKLSLKKFKKNIKKNT